MTFAIGRHVSKISGYAPSLPTPFTKTGALDTIAFETLCRRQIKEGATALVVCGTTGESSTLSKQERHTLIRIAADVAKGQIPVIAGAGSNATDQAIVLTKEAELAGADAILSVVPYYNKPNQNGLYAHFHAIAESTPLPIILYDVPLRSGCSLSDETVVRLAEMPGVIGLKDASGDLARPARLRSLIGRSFRLLSGDDATALAFIAQGGDGCISVTSNVAPRLCRGMYLAFRQGETARAQRLAIPITRLSTCLSLESNPSPLKYALHLFGLTLPTVRLPLVEASDETKKAVAETLASVWECYANCMIGELSVQDGTGRRAAAR
jgi:4-hydroxy-tetrahydrodipicolinate synthase